MGGLTALDRLARPKSKQVGTQPGNRQKSQRVEMSSILRGSATVWRRTRPAVVLITAAGLSAVTLTGLAGTIGH